MMPASDRCGSLCLRLDRSIHDIRLVDIRSCACIHTQLATITRHVQSVRKSLREALESVVAQWSFTPEEHAEISQAGLGGDDRLFDEAIAEIYHAHEARRRAEDAQTRSAGAP